MEIVELFNTPEMTAYLCVIAAILGLVMGSFLTCAAGRMLAGESFISGRSHCDACGHELGAADLIPVFSWLFGRGRCRYCGVHLSALYPASEAVCALVYVSIVAIFGFSWTTLEYLVLASVLFCIAMTDLLGYTIPNGLVLFGIGAWVVFRACFGIAGIEQPLPAITGGLISALVASVPVLLVALLLERLRGQAALGGGDVKLLFMTGLYFTWQLALLGLFLSCIIGIVVGVLGRKSLAQQGEGVDYDATQDAEDAESADGAAAATVTASAAAAATSPEALESPVQAPKSPDSPKTPAPNLKKPVGSALIPFGTAIAVGFWITMCAGMQILGWYMALF